MRDLKTLRLEQGRAITSGIEDVIGEDINGTIEVLNKSFCANNQNVGAENVKETDGKDPLAFLDVIFNCCVSKRLARGLGERPSGFV